MPVILVHAGDPPDSDPAGALAAVATAAAEALGLGPDDVHVMLLPAGPASTGAQADRPWPTAVLHGRARDPARMHGCALAVVAALAARWEQPPERVWVQWAVAP